MENKYKKIKGQMYIILYSSIVEIQNPENNTYIPDIQVCYQKDFSFFAKGNGTIGSNKMYDVPCV